MNDQINYINEKIYRAITRYNMLENIHTIIIGVSGGADSMALLKFFIEYSKNYPLKVIAAHVNHCLRGEESLRDEDFVKEYCIRNDVQFELLRVEINTKAKTMGNSIEECARKIRYEFFEKLAQQYNGKIATAHTLSDSIETMLINLTRGTGSAGLSGIPPIRNNIIRPLIFLKRDETQKYCEEYDISYVVDSTNLSRKYTRNKIRLDVIPIFKSINPEFETAAFRMLSILKSDDDYLNSIAKDILKSCKVDVGVYSLSDMRNQPFPILSRCIRLAVFDFVKSNVTAQHTDLILNIIRNGSGAVTLPNKIKVSVNKNTLVIEKEKHIIFNDFEVPFKEGSILTDYNREFIIKVINKEAYNKVNNLLFFYALDYDTITKDTVFRNRKSGDKFLEGGRGVTKSVKKLFNELHIPVSDRNKILMLANKNEILWINNIGVSESAKVTENTEKIVLIYLKEK